MKFLASNLLKLKYYQITKRVLKITRGFDFTARFYSMDNFTLWISSTKGKLVIETMRKKHLNIKWNWITRTHFSAWAKHGNFFHLPKPSVVFLKFFHNQNVHHLNLFIFSVVYCFTSCYYSNGKTCRMGTGLNQQVYFLMGGHRSVF